VWFVIFLATMMLPGQVTMIPLFILFKKLGWVDTYLPLIVPYYFGSSPAPRPQRRPRAGTRAPIPLRERRLDPQRNAPHPPRPCR
jgi:hypothetical protein